MSNLTYNGHDHTIEIFDERGKSLGKWSAYNNIDRKFAKAHYHSLTHLKDGTYTVQDRKAPHSHTASANGPYGLYGIIRFDYPGHSGVGLHSGRANAAHMPGPQHPTHGCIRTTDKAMAAIKRVMSTDPVKSIKIVGNSVHSVTHGEHKQSVSHGGLEHGSH